MTFSVTPLPIEVGTSKVADSVDPGCRAPRLKVIVSIVSAFARPAPAISKTAESHTFIKVPYIEIGFPGREPNLAHIFFLCQNETPVYALETRCGSVLSEHKKRQRREPSP